MNNEPAAPAAIARLFVLGGGVGTDSAFGTNGIPFRKRNYLSLHPGISG
jgi:hypothetical protein